MTDITPTAPPTLDLDALESRLDHHAHGAWRIPEEPLFSLPADELRAIIVLARRELERDTRVSTHAPGCHAWGPRHYECLMREYEAARAVLIQAQEALRPFEVDEEKRREYTVLPDGWLIGGSSLTLGDLRRASSARAEIRKVLG